MAAVQPASDSEHVTVIDLQCEHCGGPMDATEPQTTRDEQAGTFLLVMRYTLFCQACNSHLLVQSQINGHEGYGVRPVVNEVNISAGRDVNISGDVVGGDVVEGDKITIHSGPVATNGGEAADWRGARGTVYRPQGPVVQRYGDRVIYTPDRDNWEG